MESTNASILLRKLEELRRIDRSFATFGSSSHQYRLEPPLPRAKLESFEAEHSIVLPEPYRTFISELSNGGAGPYCGLFPLGYFDGSGGPLERWSEGDGFAGQLSRPFPHRQPWSLPDSRYKCPDAFETEEEEEAWYKALEDETWKPELVDGAFPICHQGCAIRNLLVVTGPERGKVWVDDRASDGGIFPEGDDPNSGISFFDWYSDWLDRSIAALK